MEVQPSSKTQVKSEWKILIVDDDEDDFLIAREMLQEAKGRKFDVHWANTYPAGREKLLSNHYHAVLVDYDLGIHSGIDLIREANEWGYPSPLILFTGRGSYAVDVEAMQAGATLYLTKGEVNPLLLERAIRYAIELKQKEQALLERDRRLSVVVEAAELGTWTYNFKDHSFEMDERAQMLYRASGPRESHDRMVQEFLHPDDIPGMWAALSKAADPTDDGRYQAAYRILQPNGNMCWINAWGLTEFEGQGTERRAVRLIGASRDLTEQVHSAEALRESEQHLRDTLESITDGFLAIDRNWVYTYVNETGARMLNTQPENMVGGCVWDLYPAARDSLFYTEYHRAVETNQPVHFEEYYPDPLNMWIECHCYPNKDGLTVYFRDVTERKQAEELLQQSLVKAEEGQRTLEALMEYIPEGITIAEGPEVTLRMVSRYGQEILGGALDQMTADQVVDRLKVYDQDGVTPLPNDQLPLVRAIQRGEVVKNQDLVQVNSQGQRLYLSCNAGPIRDAAGKITGGVVAWREISERKQMEDQLRQSNQALLQMQEQLREQKDLLERLVQNAPAGIAFQTGPDYVYTLANQEYLRFAHGKGELIGRTVAEVWPEIVEIVLPQYDQVFQTGEPFSVRDARLRIIRNGVAEINYYTYTHTPIYKADGRIEGVMTLALDTTQAVLNREAVEAQSARLEAVLQALPVGVWISDADSRVIGKNEQADRIWAGDAPLSENWKQYGEYQMWDPVSGEARALEEYPLVRALHTGQPVEPVENRIQRFDGSEGYVLISAAPIKDREDRLMGSVAICLDITERKWAEALLRQSHEALRESEERYRKLVEMAQEGIWTLDAEGKTTLINPFGAQILGYTVEEMLGRSATDFLFPEDVPLGEHELEKRRQGIGEYLDFRMRRKDGTPVWVSSSSVPFLSETGEYQGALAMFTDSTERRQAEEALRESEQKSREILESISDGFFSFDREWRVTYINPQAGEQGGYRAEKLIGTVIWESVPQLRSSDLGAIYRKVMAERQPETTEFHSAQSGRWFRLRIYPSTVGISVFSVDVTAEKQAEKELQRYAQELERSNQALQDFAFVASHDLQEPLRKILMFGNSLRKHLCAPPNEAVDDNLDRMLNAAERMQTMIAGLLDLSRINARGRVFKSVHLTRVVEEVVSDLELRIQAVKGQVTIGELPMIEADELQMRQLFQNLIGNAIKFHQPGVPPIVNVSGMVDQTKQPRMVEIRVGDNGIGFEQKDADRIFQPFQRLHGRSEYEGTGLGLAICQKIVERHHGTIVVQSVPGEGTSFTVRLPFNVG